MSYIITPHEKWAAVALGIAGSADVSAKENNTVAKIGALLGRQNGPQLVFHFFGLLTLRKP